MATSEGKFSTQPVQNISSETFKNNPKYRLSEKSLLRDVLTMYEILEKKILSDNVKLMVVKAPLVAKKAQAGQFIILRIDERGERIPLTIANFDRKKGTITIIFMEVGKTTKQLGTMKEGDKLLNFVGPLGMPSEIEKFGTVVCIGGGVGIAPLYPVIHALKQASNNVISILVNIVSISI